MVRDEKKSDNGFHMAVLSVDWCWELMFFALLTDTHWVYSCQVIIISVSIFTPRFKELKAISASIMSI